MKVPQSNPSMRHLMVIFLPVVCITNVRVNGSSEEEVQRFLTDNGHRRVNIVHNSASSQWLTFQPKNTYFSRSLLKKAPWNRDDMFSIYFFEAGRDNLEEFLTDIKRRKIRMSLLLFIKPWISEEKTYLVKQLKELQLKTLFYAAVPSGNSKKLSWYQIISVASGSIIDNLSFVNDSYLIIESYDFQGLEISSTTDTWAPYYTIEGCNELGLECAMSFGYFKDVMDILAARYNFTLVSHKNLDGDWGLMPKSGSFNINGTWGGIMGDVINKKYDMCISAWSWNIDRHDLLQFSPMATTRKMCVLTPDKTTDFGLFVRVFKSDLWVAITSIIGAIVISFIVTKVLQPGEQSSGQQLMIFISWAFFVIVNAYYGGALTMFFTSPTIIPFQTERDVIRAHPDWSIWVRSAQEHHIYTHVLKGDPDYIKLWQRYSKDPKGTIYHSEKEGLEIISRGKHVMMTDETKLMGHLKSNPSDQKLFYFAYSKWQYRNLLFYKNSPVLPMFNQGGQYLREKGIIDQLHLKWIGASNENEGSEFMQIMVLTGGQTVMLFALLGGILGASLVTLCGELIFRAIMPTATHKRSHAWQ